MRSANSKPQPSNQFLLDSIKPRPHLFLFQKRFTRYTVEFPVSFMCHDAENLAERVNRKLTITILA